MTNSLGRGRKTEHYAATPAGPGQTPATAVVTTTPATPAIRAGVVGGLGSNSTQAGAGVPLCLVCGQPLNPALAEQGDTTHPTCDPENRAEHHR